MRFKISIIIFGSSLLIQFIKMIAYSSIVLVEKILPVCIRIHFLMLFMKFSSFLASAMPVQRNICNCSDRHLTLAVAVPLLDEPKKQGEIKIEEIIKFPYYFSLFQKRIDRIWQTSTSLSVGIQFIWRFTVKWNQIWMSL